MNYLVAKTKGIKGDTLKVLSSDESIFDLPNISENKEYTASYKLEDDEWFVLKKFSESNYKNDFIVKSFSTTDLNQIKPDQYSKINFLCSIQNDVHIFQKMSSKQLFKKKWFQIKDTPDLMIDVPILVIDENIDAIYNKKDDSLYFKNIVRIKSIFKGIEELYREATNEEVNTFLKQEFIILKDDYSVKSVKTLNRKRIALAMDTLKNYSPQDKKSIFKYIKGYCPDVPFDNNAFNISNEEHLKKILFGIEQRYYTTILGNEKRLANSVIKLKQ